MNDENQFQNQIDTIRQTFGYLQKFKNSVFVIKIDGRLVGNPLSPLLSDPVFSLLIRDVVLLHNLGIKVVLVPGTRVHINGILASFGIKTEEYNGIRISTEEAIPFIKMATFDVANQIMTMLAENNANAVIGNWVRARGMGIIDGVDFQASGLVDKIDVESIRNVLDNNMIPIFPNIGWSLSGKPYNISSHELAHKISVAMQAEKLFFITDFGGISFNGSLISQLTLKEAKQLLANTSDNEKDENFELLKLSYEAAKSGVKRVHIVDGHCDGMLLKEIFSNIGQGTMIYSDEFDSIRKLTYSDIPEISRITRPLVEKGVLVERTNEEIETLIGNGEFFAYEVDGILHAVAALHAYDDNSAEICSVAVDTVYSGMGIGKKMLSFLISQAKSLGKNRCFLLTTQTGDWFEELGFVETGIENLPKIKRETYNKNRKSRVMVLNLR
jgi:amino-acid N-acetyltransferase